MAETNTAVPPANVKYQPPRRSVAGPIVLIAIGVLLLMATMHALEWRALFHNFARYWPVLIIFWGLVKMIEYFADRSAGRPARGVGAGGVVLLIFLVILGLSATGLDRLDLSGLCSEVDISNNLGGLCGKPYDFAQELQQDFPPNASLRVLSDHADITVSTWDQPRVRVVVHKTVRAFSEQEAKGIDEATHPAITTEGGVVTVDAKPARAGARDTRSELEIYVPKKAGVEVTSRRGSVTARGIQGDVAVSTSRGDVTLDDIKGSATLEMGRRAEVGRGTLQASRISGDVTVRGYLDEVKLSDVGGTARLEGEFYGPIELARIARAVSFRSTRTEMDFAKLEGDLRLDSGDLRGTAITGPLRLVTHASKDIRLENVTGAVTVENRSGSVELHAGKLPLAAMQITNRNGDVQVVLPAKAAFELEATADRGDINSDFPGLKVETRGNETRASGTVGSGGPRLQINNEHGNVEIRKAG